MQIVNPYRIEREILRKLYSSEIQIAFPLQTQ